MPHLKFHEVNIVTDFNNILLCMTYVERERESVREIERDILIYSLYNFTDSFKLCGIVTSCILIQNIEIVELSV